MNTIIILAACIAAALAGPAPAPTEAELCNPDVCVIENNCRCSMVDNPITTPEDPAPQLIAITVSESIVQTLFDDYLGPLFFDRGNPDGWPISMTYYVNHEFTDYTLVNQLYLYGYEIGSHSITKDFSQEYWRTASEEVLTQEFGGQKTILAQFANIPEEDITGVRTPQLQLQGDVSIQAYMAAGLSYDNSWPTPVAAPLLSYTLDYKTTQQCLVSMGSCPSESHPGFWIAPITNINGNSLECNSLATCEVSGTAQDISDWLLKEVDRVRESNRAPMMIRLDSYWFNQTANSFEGFSQFLDQLQTRPDTFLVSVQDIQTWIKNPVPLSQFKSTDNTGRAVDCYPVRCQYNYEDGSKKYMQSCTACPPLYPWLGNPLGQLP